MTLAMYVLIIREVITKMVAKMTDSIITNAIIDLRYRQCVNFLPSDCPTLRCTQVGTLYCLTNHTLLD